jgi:hypothetical protein
MQWPDAAPWWQSRHLLSRHLAVSLLALFVVTAGGFVTSVSGIVYEAAEKLSCTALDSARPTSIMVTDGLALLLGSSHALRFAPGGYLLKGPRSIGISDVGGEVRLARCWCTLPVVHASQAAKEHWYCCCKSLTAAPACGLCRSMHTWSSAGIEQATRQQPQCAM